MTRVAARQAANVILLHQLAAERDLVCRNAIIHGEDFIPRADVAFRMPVTVEAPFHGEGLRLPGEIHFVDAAVACRAPDALCDMNAVVEIHEVGQIVNARPFDGLPSPIAFAHGFKSGGGRPHLRMAVHADLRRWNIGKRGGLDGRMAIPAIDTETTNVVRVTERNRLLAGHVLHGFVM